MIRPRCGISLFLLFTILYSVSPGQSLISKKFGNKDSLEKFAPNTALYQVVQGGKVLSSTNENRDQNVNIIVELVTPPTFLTKGRSAINAAAGVERTAFINKALTTSSAIQILRQFSEVVSAISLSISRSEIEKIANLSEVKRIEEDRVVTGFANPATPKNTSTLQRSSNSAASGKGVRIGVIDSGIDYMHEALGSGFGPGFKVAGGYDFVNNDADPSDDNGHGTHVAGIISGNSAQLKSIAPDAQLFAYKVLDASGNGSTSSVIAAIEQAIKDSVDIINLSLGTTGGDPDDILSHAVDGAVEADIVVVVAAGNDGEYGTISSPGSARQAITVGAIDSKNAIASFSSKGPSNRIYGVKPDIVAPGEAISSSKMSGGYVTMSGTSMAAPYITAVAANLMSLHPLWSAQEIRGGVIAATRDLHLPLFGQGKGRIDTSRVGSMQTLATPAALSFGFDNSSSGSWTKADSFLLSNISSETKSYTLRNIPSHDGFDIQFSGASVSLDPQENKYVAVTLSVSNASLANNANLSDGYGGRILVASDSDTLTLPYVFFKGPVFRISLSEIPFQVVIHDQKKNVYYFNPKSTFLTAVVPPGVYDIITAFSSSAYVIREKINTGENLELNIRRSQANNLVTIAPIDEAERPLAPAGSNTSFCYVEALTHNSSGISEVVMGGGKVQTASLVQKKYFSSMSSEYSFGYALNVQFGNSKSYTVDVEVDSGITSPLSFKFAASDLKRVDFKYDIDSTTARAFPVTWLTFVQQNNIVAVTYYDGNDAPLHYPFIQTGYYTRRTSSKFPIFHFREAYKY